MSDAPTLVNHMKEALLRGEVASTLSARLVRSNELPMMAKTAGYEGLLIDMEHSSFDFDVTSQLCMASLYAGITPIVRSPSKEHFFVSRILDGGALGIIVPHIKTAQDVREVVAAARYPPIGNRSTSGGLPHFQFRSVSAAVANPLANRNTLVIPMIETPEALENVEEIAAVEGIDSLLIGSNDLAAELGIPGDFDHPLLADAYNKVIAACDKAGVWVGVGGLHARLDLVEKFCARGARWVMAATDGPLLTAGANKRRKEMAQLSERVFGPDKVSS